MPRRPLPAARRGVGGAPLPSLRPSTPRETPRAAGGRRRGRTPRRSCPARSPPPPRPANGPPHGTTRAPGQLLTLRRGRPRTRAGFLRAGLRHRRCLAPAPHACGVSPRQACRARARLRPTPSRPVKAGLRVCRPRPPRRPPRWGPTPLTRAPGASRPEIIFRCPDPSGGPLPLRRTEGAAAANTWLAPTPQPNAAEAARIIVMTPNITPLDA
jgi:hypothetical protein